LWNSGIFCWSAETILREIKHAAPELHSAIWRIAEAWNTPKREAVFAREFEPLQKISIDYAVMEKARHVAVVEAPFQWDDVGSWLALERVMDKDDDDNVLLGRHEGLGTRQCVVVGGEGHLVSTIGVENLIIVHTPDVTLVAHRNDEQSVKNLLAKLEQLGLSHLL
jgi:mannose-1-phosphate guanylyltransferase